MGGPGVRNPRIRRHRTQGNHKRKITMSFTLSFNVARNNKAKNHGSLTFTPSSTSAGTVQANTLNHGTQPSANNGWNYSIASDNISFSVDLNSNGGNGTIVLSGNTEGNSITYTSMTGKIVGSVDANGVFAAINNGALQPNSSSGEPGGGDDSWSASASEGGEAEPYKAKA
jgi:hypothetical protein